MTAFCRWWALASIGLVALASLGLRSDNSNIVGKQAEAPIGALGCEVNASTAAWSRSGTPTRRRTSLSCCLTPIFDGV